MGRKFFIIGYALFMLVIILLLVFIKDMNDMVQMILGTLAIVTTSVFTYANRK